MSDPKGQVYAEALLGYRKRVFWDVQAGIGLVHGIDSSTYSFSGALTYSYLLNPYRWTQCNPVPGYTALEAYLEEGKVSFFCDTKYKNNVFYVSKDGREPIFSTPGLAGLRLNFITGKLIYI